MNTQISPFALFLIIAGGVTVGIVVANKFVQPPPEPAWKRLLRGGTAAIVSGATGALATRVLT